LTGPIWDLVTLGGHPDVPRDILHDLLMWLAPHLRTVQTEDVADQAGQGPLMWSPASPTRSKVDFHYTDHTAGVVEYGPYSVSTKDELVRIMEEDRHVGTIYQGGSSLLTVENDPEGTCASLPGWIAQVEKEETLKGVPSAQFWNVLGASLAIDCIIGCSPLVAPSSFPMALNPKP
jgi:hypothetical protein